MGTILEDPSLLDWEEIVSSGHGKKDFVIKNDLDKAIEADQKIFEKQMLGNDTVVEPDTQANNNIAKLQSEIKDKVSKLNPVAKKTMKDKLTNAGLPVTYNKVADEAILKQILEVVSE